jgi:hypothetical protein
MNSRGTIHNAGVVYSISHQVVDCLTLPREIREGNLTVEQVDEAVGALPVHRAARVSHARGLGDFSGKHSLFQWRHDGTGYRAICVFLCFEKYKHLVERYARHTVCAWVQTNLVIVKLNRLKQHVHNGRGVTLSFLGVSTSAPGVWEIVSTVTNLAQMAGQGRSQSHDAPRLANRVSLLVPELGHETVLTSIEVSITETILRKGFDDSRVPPVQTMSR